MKEEDEGIKWFTTEFYPENKVARAVRFEDGVLSRLRKKVITLFTPWGFRYKYHVRDIYISKDDKEVQLLQFFAKTLRELRENMRGREWRWAFLAADSYATRINGEREEICVIKYFQELNRWFKEIMPENTILAKWSVYDYGESAIEYRQKVENNFSNYVSQTSFKRRLSATEKLNKEEIICVGGRIEESARAYCVERITEALWIEEMFHPIKISAARRDKDDGLDGNLPRLYIVPEKLQAPWL